MRKTTRRSIEDRLRSTGYAPLTSLQIEIDEGIVILSGSLNSYYLKQIAQTVVFQVDGVTQVQNNVEVVTCLPSKKNGTKLRKLT